MWDMGPFILVLLMSMISFSTTFGVLQRNIGGGVPDSEEDDNFVTSLRDIYLLMFGEFSTDDY